MSVKVIAISGNAAHLPANTLEACLSAYTAGADGLLITVQCTSDGALVIYDREDLAEQTNQSGSVAAATLVRLLEADAGAAFGLGWDKPWKQNPKVSRHITLGRLDLLLMRLEDNVTYFIRPGMPNQSPIEKLDVAHAVLAAFQAVNRATPVLVADGLELAEAMRSKLTGKWSLALLPPAPGFDAGRMRAIAPDFAFGDQPTLKALMAALENTQVHFGLVGTAGELSEGTELLLTADVIKQAAALGLRVRRLQDDWPGKVIDRERWVVGISSGHHIMLPMLGIAEYVEPVFGASATADNGLRISVVEGRTYASAAAVSRFTLGEDFTVDVDFTYDNPQISNMMVLAVINQEVWTSYYHHEGVQRYVDAIYQNHAFDTHGAAPLVSMEREEADGFRLMKYSSTAGVYEWYGNYYLGDVGNGDSRRGKLRLERRGRFFTGYYQDENNNEWIGVGTLENSSMNSRVYLRIGAKHYPKTGGPTDLFPLEVKYNHLVVQAPPGRVFEGGVARPIQVNDEVAP